MNYEKLLEEFEEKAKNPDMHHLELAEIRIQLSSLYHDLNYKHNKLKKAAHQVVSYTHIADRPPVADEIETGRMTTVRVHALADLYKALQID